MPPKVVKVAAIQAAPVAFDLPKTLDKVAHLTAQAAGQGAQLIVFPEAFLSAYPWRYAFDATVGAREPRGRKWYAKYVDSSIVVPSLEFNALQEIARSSEVYLQLGIVEKDGGTLYCTALLLGPDGEMLYRHRKLIPTACERLIWGRGAGDGLQVVDTALGKIGGLICWENYMPAARLALYHQGIEIYLAPNADDLPTWIASMQHIAKEGRCFVISVNQFCKVSDFPEDYPPFIESPGEDSILSHGGSCIVGPLGTMIAEPVWDREATVYADLDMNEITEARLDFDVVGSYSRPDIFELRVNMRPMTNVSLKAGDEVSP